MYRTCRAVVTATRKPAAILITLMFFGCASVPADLGRSEVDTLIAKHGGPAAPIEGALHADPAEPLTAAAAARIALTNNQALKRKFAELGVGAADLYAASRVSNPVLSAGVFASSERGARDQVTVGLIASFTDLLTLSKRRRLAATEFSALQQEVAHAALEMVSQALAAFYAYVGAVQINEVQSRAAQAAQASYELARRFAEAGNISPRALALAQADAATAELQVLQAQRAVAVARAELADALGLSSGDVWQVSSGFNPPSDDGVELDALLRLADRRLDLNAARQRAKNLAEREALTAWASRLDDLHLGFEWERETDGARLRGPTAEWPIPIFSQNRDQRLRVEAEMIQAVAQLQEQLVTVDNEVRSAHADLENARARTRVFAQQLVPARKAGTLRAQEEENFMLVGVFEVLEARQQEFDSYAGYLESLRDYWLAQTRLSFVVGELVPAVEVAHGARIDAASLLGSDSGAHDAHRGHGASEEPQPRPEESGHRHHHHGGGR